MLRLLFLVSFSSLAVAAYADDSPIVVTATRVASPADKVPASVTVLTQKDFAAKGATTLAQALQGVPGVNVVQSGGNGTQTSVFMRGSGSSDVLVLQDGVPVNDPVTSNGEYNFGNLTLEDVQQIEIIRGPVAGEYGSGALGGVINIITKRGTQPGSTSVTLAGGFPAQGQVSAQTSGVRGKLDYAFTGALQGEAGFDNTPQRMTSVYANHRDAYRSKLAAAQLGYEIAPETRLYAIVRAQGTHSATPAYGFDDPDQTDDSTQLFGKLGVSSALADGRWRSDLFVARLATQLRYLNQLDAADPSGAVGNETYSGGRTDVQWNNSYRLPDTGVARFSTVTFGAEYADSTAREKAFDSYYGYPSDAFLQASQHEWAGHVGGQTTLAGRLTLLGALRDDAVSSFGNAVTWQVGSVLELPEVDGRLKASVGSGFEAPALYELHYVDYYGQGNPNLRPEYSLGWQMGPEFQVPLFGREDGADLSVTYFASDMRDLIVSTYAGGVDSYANAARAHISGVENSLDVHPLPWLSAEFGYTYTHVDSGNEGAKLRRPTSEADASVTVTPLPRLSLTANVQYTGRFLDVVYDDYGNYLGTRSSNPGTVMNVSGQYVINPRFTGFVSARNLFDSRFEPTNGLQIDGPSVLVGVKAALN